MPDRPGLITPPPKTYKIAIFDFDGTLVDTASIYPFIHKEVLRELGVEEEELSYLTLPFWQKEIAEVGEHIDVPAFCIAKHNLENVVNGLEFRKLRNRIEQEYFDGIRNIFDLELLDAYQNIPVVRDLIQYHTDGTECYIVSNNYGIIIEKALSTLGLSEYFVDCYTHCRHAEFKHPTYDKTQPKRISYEQLIAHARELDGDASDCVVYDDLMVYIETARELGMEAVWIDNEHSMPRE